MLHCVLNRDDVKKCKLENEMCNDFIDHDTQIELLNKHRKANDILNDNQSSEKEKYFAEKDMLMVETRLSLANYHHLRNLLKRKRYEEAIQFINTDC